MDRRTTLKWMLAVSAAGPFVAGRAAAAAAAPPPGGAGYGSDPDLMAAHHAGEFWPLTLTASERRLARALSDLIIPADAHSPSASAVGVVDFLDEWVSAPYPRQQADAVTVRAGFAWLDAQARSASGTGFADLTLEAQVRLCDTICSVARAAADRLEPARFFARYRDLTAAAFYTSPAGRKDLGYIGNVALARFDGPPQALLKKLDLL